MSRMNSMKDGDEQNHSSWVDDGKHYDNKRLEGADFSNRDLSNASFRNAYLVEANFENAILVGVNFTDANLWGAKFKGARLYKTNFTRANVTKADVSQAIDLRNVTITLDCQTFEGVKLGKKWLNGWLFLLSMADIPEDVKLRLKDIIGPEQYDMLHRIRMGI